MVRVHRPCSAPLSRCPLDGELLPRVGTFGQIEIDQILAGNPDLFGQGLEVGDCIRVEMERAPAF